MPVASRNPYLRRNSVYHGPISANPTTTTTTMGLQSQHRLTDRERNRSINKATEARKKERKNQTTINGIAAFESLRHCGVCKAIGRGVN
jgi:hypothetical protein